MLVTTFGFVSPLGLGYRPFITLSFNPHDMDISRRALLAGGGGVVASMSGCASLGTNESLSIRILNHTSETQRLDVRALREDETEYDEALTFNEVFEVPPRQDEEIGEVRVSNALDRRRYLFRVDLREERGPEFTHHYYPGETTGDWVNVRVYREGDTGSASVEMPR